MPPEASTESAPVPAPPSPPEHISRLLSQEWSVAQWLDAEIRHLPPLLLKSDHSLLSTYTNLVDALRWQLEQTELRKSIEFETAARQYTATLPQTHRSLQGLRVLPNGLPGPLEQLEDHFARAELLVEQVRQARDREGMERIRELARKKSLLLKLQRRARAELEWRQLVAAMEQAMGEADIDAAQSCLEQLDRQFTEGWTGEEPKRRRLEELRQRLVDIIRSM